MANKKIKVIGLISDTHGLIRPQALEALRKVDLIIHAGDIGKPEVIKTLKSIAPVIAIKGNNDTQGWAKKFPAVRSVRDNQANIYVIHNIKELAFDPARRGFHAVISGHSHKPLISKRDAVLFVNPGSAGPRRFKLPVAVAKLRVTEQSIEAEIIELDV
jgi:putative phosphoesterase